MPQISMDLEGQFRRKIFAQGFFFLKLEWMLGTYFLMNLGGFLGSSWLKDHPWQAVPNLPHPLVSLWSHPGMVSAERDTCANAVELYLHKTLGWVPLLLDELWRLSWLLLVEGSPWTGSSRPTTSPGQHLKPSWSGQCLKRQVQKLWNCICTTP